MSRSSKQAWHHPWSPGRKALVKNSKSWQGWPLGEYDWLTLASSKSWWWPVSQSVWRAVLLQLQDGSVFCGQCSRTVRAALTTQHGASPAPVLALPQLLQRDNPDNSSVVKDVTRAMVFSPLCTASHLTYCILRCSCYFFHCCDLKETT